jgi:hypothetical protein
MPLVRENVAAVAAPPSPVFEVLEPVPANVFIRNWDCEQTAAMRFRNIAHAKKKQQLQLGR